MESNTKLFHHRELYDVLQVDIAAMNEHRINLNHKSNINGLRKMFHGGEADIWVVSAHNCHKNVSRIQEGGTALLTYGPLLDYYNGSEKDASGLGRWVVMSFKGSESESDMRLQPMPQPKPKLTDIIPTTAAILDQCTQ